ncbi:MAG: hypothetical protein ACI8XB_002328 [Patiriisocius sp.]|jgi:hypothetical protein
MKTTLLGLALSLIMCNLNAQEIEKTYVNNKRIVSDNQETIFGDEFSIRGFLELNSSVTTVRNQTAAMMGGGIDIVFNHKLNIGFVGTGMIAEVESPNLSFDGVNHNFIQFGYGGLKVEPVFNSNKKIHFSVPLIIGGGGLFETDFNIWDELDYYDDGFNHINHNLRRSDAIFVFEPGLNIELNLFKHARLATGAKYRMVNDVDIVNLKNADFEGLSGHISLRFGWF